MVHCTVHFTAHVGSTFCFANNYHRPEVTRLHFGIERFFNRRIAYEHKVAWTKCIVSDDCLMPLFETLCLLQFLQIHASTHFIDMLDMLCECSRAPANQL